MNAFNNSLVFVVGLLLSIFLLESCKSESDFDKSKMVSPFFDEGFYEEYRANVEYDFLTNPNSPLADAKNKNIKLQYYAPNGLYRFTSILNEFEKKDTLQLPTSKEGVLKAYLRYGVFTLNIEKDTFSIVAYRSIKYPESLFLPFLDPTNGVETYPGGRYLDLPIIKDSVYEIDFNMAYNPYCHYNDKYSCPLVPQENILNVPIKAGEKIAIK